MYLGSVRCGMCRGSIIIRMPVHAIKSNHDNRNVHGRRNRPRNCMAPILSTEKLIFLSSNSQLPYQSRRDKISPREHTVVSHTHPIIVSAGTAQRF